MDNSDSKKFSEFQFIERIREIQKSSSRVLLGIGDDCASFHVPSDDKRLLITSDLMTEGVHFELSWGSPNLLGKKSVGVNVSDIAAMGGTPLALLCVLSVPPHRDEIIMEVMEGIQEECEKFGMDLIGGDTNRAKTDLTICHTVLGEVSVAKMIGRKGAQPGDLIFCSGTIGDAGLGLQILKTPKRFSGLSSTEQEEVLQKFLQPCPRVDLAGSLANLEAVTAMIDLSDGLLQDLGHILKESKGAARLDPKSIPLSEIFRKSGLDVVQACTGGEDYELLFTAPARFAKDILGLSTPSLPITSIGEILPASQGIGKILGTGDFSWPKLPGGYQHF